MIQWHPGRNKRVRSGAWTRSSVCVLVVVLNPDHVAPPPASLATTHRSERERERACCSTSPRRRDDAHELLLGHVRHHPLRRLAHVGVAGVPRLPPRALPRRRALPAPRGLCVASSN
uniref:Uncharacterized protein n=1 Tax=Oryza barthii TaxID=65489 RepID=A0A0D3H117_9ORYZ